VLVRLLSLARIYKIQFVSSARVVLWLSERKLD
jgi:hypothetical protein